MRNNVLNFLFFLVIAVGFYFLWSHAEKNWFPQPEPKKKVEPPPPDPAEEARKAEAAKKAQEARDREGARIAVVGAAGFVAESDRPVRAERVARENRALARASVAGGPSTVVEPRPPAPKPPEVARVKPAEPPTLVPMGDAASYLRVLLSTRGGGVQQVVLTRFAEADRLGREVKLKDENGNPTKEAAPLYLIPGVPRPRPYYLADPIPLPDLKPGKVPAGTELAEPSFTVFHYPNPDDKTPDPFLGETEWRLVAEERPDGGEHRVVFEAALGGPYYAKFRKTFTLSPADYHIGLRVEIERLSLGLWGIAPPAGEKFRYQLSGPRGLPVEGEWYTNTHRTALIGWTDRKGTPRRQYETAADVAIKRGGDAVPKGENQFKYMAVATQYFTSAVAVDDTAEGAAKNPWAYVRATTEMPFDKKAGPQTVPTFEDVTVRAASDVIDLAGPGQAGDRVAHSYVVYNGPAKVKLLGLMDEARGAVSQELVDRYQYALGLKTITDYQSPTWLGSFANAIYWSDLVIAFTNLMHWLLAAIHTVVPDWALCIIVLTGIVRMILLYPSMRMTRMNMKMMAVQKRLAPQFEELKKKYGDDFHGYNRAKMQLMMANGFNPVAQMGGCLLLFLQMPIMMGLYFCLQESVFFRLEQFLWVENLAAPDMTAWWGEKIPYLSSPDNIGSFIYLGPYLNVLPIIAVVLMIGQQLLMLPPPTDEQSRQQRTMMKMMMVIMPILFYKFAAGLALYFIIGTVWALTERRFIKKPDPNAPDVAPGGGGGPPDEPEPEKPKGFLGRLKRAMRERMEEMQRQADEQSRRQIRNKGENPGASPNTGAQGPAPGGGQGPPRRDDRRDKKKKRRK